MIEIFVGSIAALLMLGCVVTLLGVYWLTKDDQLHPSEHWTAIGTVVCILVVSTYTLWSIL